MWYVRDVLLEHLLSGGIVYKSAGGPVWTAGIMKLSIKVLEDQFGLLEHLLEL